ncbi:transcriptional regulator with HTH domain and aminotransferase domain [Pseudomonas sp. GM21]|jgi:DNA-binding transcriptional MocR family regulator|uniref:aminotransferase-like domain-containing protein n=1 Tax=unclassified Pseudomonas TaxID=196821 RepID=UPI000272702C|nr:MULTISPECIES: PLP-dependent aminotransferase family protein [unclassified Pseudomonas]EJM13469.1 transcriptional regulator with HTH domain and aminotransferase domain [Pseudomonas sp. GM21]MDR6927188.1 DNA-binding transcriptional MocR family regulator [Pseudomonas sp. BE134]
MQAQRAVIAAIEFQPGAPLVQQIVDQLSEAISQGGLPHGAKLPPIRELSELMSVGKSTVVDALDRLRAKGLVVSRQGAGHYVHRASPQTPAAAGPDLQPQDTLSRVRRAVLVDNGALRPGCGFLPGSWLPADELLKAVRGTLRATSLRMGEYGEVGGYRPLREALRVKLSGIGIEVPVEQIITTANTMQAIDQLMRLLIKPGDTVLLDDPCYFNLHTNLALHGARIITLPRDCNGLDMEAFEQLLIAHRPVLYMTNSTLHNPTGHSFSAAQVYRLLELSHRYGFHIVEDDLYGDLQQRRTPRLAASGLDTVSYVSGFSKTLTANSRVSYAVLSPQLAAQMIALKMSIGGVTSELAEQIIHTMLSNGSYAKHIRRTVDRLYESSSRVANWLVEAGCSVSSVPGEGLFTWTRLPNGVHAENLADRGLKNDLVLTPGTMLSKAADANGFLRFNVAHSDDLQVRERFFRLLDK